MTVRLLISLGALALAALLPSGTAHAGTYTVHACKAPGGAKAAVPWTTEGRYPSGYFTGNACPGGYFWMDLVGSVEHPGDDFVRANFLAPPDTAITAYALRRSVQLTSPYHYDFHEITATGGFAVRETCFGDGGCRGLGDFRSATAPGNLFAAKDRTGVAGLSFSIYCRNAAPGPACPPAAPAVNFQLHAAEVTLTDASAPELLLPPSGPLVDASKPIAGSQQVFIWAADRGGGVRDVLFEVDGKVVDSVPLDDNDGACREPFSAAQPCRLEARGSVSLDTTKLSDGEHQLRLLVTDATGTNSVAWGPVRITTANGTCEPGPRSDAMTMRAAFARQPRARVRTVRFAQRPAVRGRLSLPDGTPARGVRVCVADRTATPNAPLRRVASVTTDDRGRFRYALRRGPSRRVYFVTRVDGGAVSDSVRVRVRAAAKLRASRHNLRNGESVTFRGKLAGGPFPRLGTQVELQVLKPDGWQTFGTTRTVGKGRYRYTYPFSRSVGVVRYYFRALVPTQAAYPYTTGASRRLAVTVRG